MTLAQIPQVYLVLAFLLFAIIILVCRLVACSSPDAAP